MRPVQLRVLTLNDELLEVAELRQINEWLVFFSEPADQTRACVRVKGGVVVSVRFDEPIATCIQATEDAEIDVIRLPWSGVEAVRRYHEPNRLSENEDLFLVPGCRESLTYPQMQSYLMKKTRKQPICVPQKPLSNVRSLFGKLASPDHELLFPRGQ